MDANALMAIASSCARQVDVITTRALIAVESGFNPHAIGVVGGVLERQPKSHGEALATARELRGAGWNFSVGLAQINVRTLDTLGLPLEQAFDPCRNLAAMQTVLGACLRRSSIAESLPQQALRQALSCYYSGNFTTGFAHGYVQRVVAAAARAQPPAVSAAQPSIHLER